MVAYENPQTLRHMCNRLRRLGYVVISTKWSSGQSAWKIDLAGGKILYLYDRGKVTLGPFQRDRDLERLFNIARPSDRFAYPLSSPVAVGGTSRKIKKP
jgi:hypothetical protein